MIVINKNTRQDVTVFFLQYMEGKLTKVEFEEIAGVHKEEVESYQYEK